MNPQVDYQDNNSILAQMGSNLKVTLERDYYKHHVKEYMELVVSKVWYKQVEILESIRDYDITCVRSANDVGKTLSVAIAVNWIMDCWRPYAKVISTARNYSALQFMLWSRIRTVYTKLSYRFNHVPMNLLDFKPDKSLPEWFAVGYNPEVKGDEAEAFQGHHAPPAPSGADSICVFVIDEGITTHPAIWKAIEGSLFSKGTKLIVIYNPTDVTSPVKSYETDSRTNLITISHEDFFNSPEYLESPELFDQLADPVKSKAFVKIYGENSPIVKARVKAEWAKEGEDVAVKYSWCVNARDRYTEAKGKLEDLEKHFGEIEKILYSWDVAGEGTDKNAIKKFVETDKYIIQSKVIDNWNALPDESLMKVYDIIKQEMDLFTKDDVEFHLVVDAIGEGSHVPSFMTQYLPDLYTVGFKAGEKASKIPERSDIVLFNKISEAWYRTNLLMSGVIPEWKTIICDMDTKTIHELSSRKYAHAMKAKEPLVWFIEPKDKWKLKNRGKSPDDADAFVMGVWGLFNSQPARIFGV